MAEASRNRGQHTPRRRDEYYHHQDRRFDRDNTYLEPFSRNKMRSTMPIKPGFRAPSTPRTNPYYQRFPPANCPSPSASFASNGTTYTQPWNSTRFESPREEEQQKQAKKPLRRSVSMLEKPQESNGKPNEKNVEEESGHKISSFGKKIMRPILMFAEMRKGESTNKKGTKALTSEDRARPSSSSESCETKKVKIPTTNTISKMQKEDKMKMFRKVGMKQSMKMSNVQRMQMERQRDFALVPAQGNRPASSKLAEESTYASIDSMLVLTSPINKTNQLSLNDDDVEVMPKNPHNIALKRKGPSMTSTPKLYVGSNQVRSPENDHLNISNVRSLSNTSFCIDAATPKKDKTMYFSAVGLAQEATYSQMNKIESEVATTSTVKKPETKQVVIKPETIDPSYETTESISSGQGMSVADTTSTAGTPDIPNLPVPNTPNPDQLAELWRISQVLKEKKAYIEQVYPTYHTLRSRLMEIGSSKAKLLIDGGLLPTEESMKTLWHLSQEEESLKTTVFEMERNTNEARSLIQFLESRKDALLNGANLHECHV